CALAVVKGKEEKLVLLDRAANRSTKRVANERARTVGQPRIYLGLFVEPIVRLAKIRAVVFVQRTVEIVCAALSDQAHLCARRPARISVRVAGGYTEFLDRIERSSKGALKSIAQQLVVII